MRLAACAIGAFFLALAPAAAQQETSQPEPESREIDIRRAAGQDAEIAERLTGIFSEIEEFARVEVTVRQGVVTLAGDVPSDAAIDRAERLASRLAGVATVENQLQRALDVQSNVSPLLDRLASSTERLARAWPVYVIAFAIFVLIGGLGFLIAAPERLWLRLTPNPFVAALIRQVIRVVFVIAGLVTALSVLGAVALIGALAGGAGLAGLAIGFAVRDTIENYVASVMLSVRQPFRANDLVAINNHHGNVIRLTSRATILMTEEGNHLRIPNSDVFKAVIVNYTRNPERRLDFKLGIGDNEDPIGAIEAGLAALCELDFTLDEPKPIGLIHEIGDSTIVLHFMAWVDQRATGFLKARSLAIGATKQALETAGFTLPEPTYRLRFEDGPGIAAGAQDRSGAKRPPAAQPAPLSSPVTPSTEALDVTPDTFVESKVDEERADNHGADLLDDSRPVE